MRRAVVVALVVAFGRAAAADPTVLRLATVSPTGSAWARELLSFSRDLERRTNGEVKMKFYLDGVVGGEHEMIDRMHHGQIDAMASGGPACTEAMPSLLILGMPALFQSWDEAAFVINGLNARLEAEAQNSGYVYLGGSVLGTSMFFVKQPVKSWSELRARRYWIWNFPIARDAALAMGFSLVPAELDQATALARAGKIDGFLALPAASLAFQWSIEAPYLVELRQNVLFACVLMSPRVYHSLTPEQQRQLQTTTAQLRERVNDVGRSMETGLLEGGFAHQGVKRMPVSESMRAEFFAAARAARERMTQHWSPELVREVQEKLADYRAEHSGR
jgi:TRAP-type transport system periplasmic protein